MADVITAIDFGEPPEPLDAQARLLQAERTDLIAVLHLCESNNPRRWPAELDPAMERLNAARQAEVDLITEALEQAGYPLDPETPNQEGASQ